MVERYQTLTEGVRSLPSVHRKISVPDVGFGLGGRGFLTHIRVSQFKGGGTILGVAWNHAIGDWQTFLDFMRAWSDHCAGRPSTPPVLIQDRDRYIEEHCEDPYDTPGLKFMGYPEFIGFVVRLLASQRRQKIAMLHFTDEELATIKQDLRAHSELPLSSSDALMGHLVTTLNELDPRTDPRLVTMPINYRKRKGMEANTVGNYFGMLTVPSEPDDSAVAFAERVRNSVAAWQPRYRTMKEFVNSKGGGTALYRFMADDIDVIHGPTLSNITRFGLFDLDFGVAPISFLMPILVAAFPWYGVINEGYGGAGTQVCFNMPATVAERLAQPEVQARLHRFRSNEGAVPREQLPWLL